MAAISAGFNGAPSGGMRSSASFEVNRESNSLSAGLPIASTSSPFAPLRKFAAESTRNPAFCFNAP